VRILLSVHHIDRPKSEMGTAHSFSIERFRHGSKQATDKTESGKQRRTPVYRDIQIGPGKPLPLRLFDPQAFVQLRTFCASVNVSQQHLLSVFHRFSPHIDCEKHRNGMKKRANRLSLINLQDEFSHMDCESVSLLFIPGIYSQNQDALRDHGADRTTIDFSGFFVLSFEFARLSWVELVRLFLEFIMPSEELDLDRTELAKTGLVEILKTLHGDLDNKIQTILAIVKAESISLRDAVTLFFLFPFLMWPLLQFQMHFRRKFLGMKFWKEDGRVSDGSQDKWTPEFPDALLALPDLAVSFSASWAISACHLATFNSRWDSRSQLQASLVEQRTKKKTRGSRAQKLKSPLFDAISAPFYPHSLPGSSVGDQDLTLVQTKKLLQEQYGAKRGADLAPEPTPRLSDPCDSGKGQSQLQWTSMVDGATGYQFFFDEQTGLSRWTHPHNPYQVEKANG